MKNNDFSSKFKNNHSKELTFFAISLLLICIRNNILVLNIYKN